MSMQLSEGYTAAILISGTEPFTTEHESIEQAREWLTTTLTGLVGGSDASFGDQQCSVLIVDNISDRTIDQWDGGAAQVAAALRGEPAPNLVRVDAGDPEWAAELGRPYIADPQVHSEIGGQYVTFGYRGVRWLIIEDMSGTPRHSSCPGTSNSPTTGSKGSRTSRQPATTCMWSRCGMR